MNINIGIISLGCPKNLVDSEVILGNLSRYGFNIVNDANMADVIIVNTCGFIDKAKQESINHILEMAEYRTKGKCRALIVIGCMAERYKEDIYKHIPEVDAVIGIKEYGKIIEVINCIFKIDEDKNKVLFMDDYIHRLRSTSPFVSYIKIAEGCNNRCSYCVIPSIRGSYKSREMNDILDEARHLQNQGVKELTIVAQDTTNYGIDLYGEKKLAELLRNLCKIEGIEWIRFLYAYPDGVTEELIDVMASEDKICNYIDLPIQHISDKILKAMGRRSSSMQIREVIGKLREKIPEIAIRTSVIVGFPGETQEDINELANFIEEIRFDRLGAFRYSREEGTPAAQYNRQVHYNVKKSRESMVMSIQGKISRYLNQCMVGSTIRVLILGKKQGNNYFGRTYRDAPDIDGIVYVKSPKELTLGSIINVKITKATQYDLEGRAEDEPS